jgi:putative tricarboxylic transport membrane protein
MFDVYVMIFFGIAGYFMQKYRFPIVPLVLCIILGPTMERAFIQSMAMSKDSLLIFFQRPISCGILILTAILILVSVKMMRRTKSMAAASAGDDVDISN